MDNSFSQPFSEVFGEYLGTEEKSGLGEVLALEGDNLKRVYLDNDLFVGIKVGEFVNIKKQVELMSTPNNDGGLVKLKYYIRHFTVEQGKNLSFTQTKEKFDKFNAIQKSIADGFESLSNSSFFTGG